MDRGGACHPSSFHRAVIRVQGETLWLMANPVVPCVALSSPLVSGHAFRDPPPEVRAAFDSVRVLDAAELRAPLTPAHRAELADADERQIGYWQPATVGEVLFNLWD